MRRLADRPAAAWLLAAVALGIAAVGAKPYAGSWNDGCRLAAVESLIDRGTLAIDDSIFCKVPPHLVAAGTPPYDPDNAGLLALGTLDKLYVRGHFHSDKPAVVSVLMAAAYQPLVWLGVPSPGERPDIFVRVMTVLTSGLGYAVAVGCMWVLGRRIGLTPGWRLAWLAGFALCTYAPTYTRYVNTHTLQLGVVAAMCVLFLRIADAERDGYSLSSPPPLWGRSAHEVSRVGGACPTAEETFAPPPADLRSATSPAEGGGEKQAAGRALTRPGTPWGLLVALGTLAGFGFNLDFGSGPPLVAAVFAAVAWRTRRVGPILAYTLAVVPWVAAGLGLNYAIGGVWKPINMYPEHYLFPGSPFTPDNLTGFFRHKPLNQVLYAAGMFLGKHGFLNHNLPLLLAAVAGWRVLRHRFPGRPELVGLFGWCAVSWLMYAVLSNNMGGACCSVRWFVPFLAPGFWVLALLLRDRPEYRRDFVALAGWGAVLGAVMWANGPWMARMVPMMWPVVGAALVTWAVVARARWRIAARGPIPDAGDQPTTRPAPAARRAA